MVQPPRGFGENPVAIYHDPDLPPSHHYLAAYRWLDGQPGGFGADAVVHLGKHGNLEWLPGKTAGHVGVVRLGRRARRPAADLPVPGQRPGRGHPGQAPGARHAGRPPDPADGARRELRRHRPAGAAARRARQHRRAGSGQAARHPPADLDADAGGQDGPRPRAWPTAPRTTRSTTCCCTSTAGCARSRTSRSATACTSWAKRRRARPNSIWCWRSCGPGSCSAASAPCPVCARHWAWPRTAATRAHPSTRRRRTARALVAALQATGWDPDAVPNLTDERGGGRGAAVRRHRGGAATGRHRRRDRPDAARARRPVHRRPGPSGSPLRGLVNVLPTGPELLLRRPQGRAVPAGLGNRVWPWRIRCWSAIAPTTAQWPRSVGLSVWGTSAMRTSGDDIAEVLALLGVRPVWDEASRRVVDLEPIALAELGRPRIDVTVRISGFFRDAFPHVVDHARRRRAAGRGSGRARRRQLRARARPGRSRRTR